MFTGGKKCFEKPLKTIYILKVQSGRVFESNKIAVFNIT